MRITLKHLKTRWNKTRLKRMRHGIFFVGSDKILNKNSNCNLFSIDAVWSKNHDLTIQKRDNNKDAKHIFISEICDTAVEEYKTVCKLLKIRIIVIVGVEIEKEFFDMSKKLLKTIPNIKIESFSI